MGSLQVLLIDEHKLVRHGLRLLLMRNSDYHVAGEVDTVQAALPLIESAQPDLILLDPMPHVEQAVALLPTVSTLAPRCRIIILTASTDALLHLQLIRHGVNGIVLKNEDSDVLFRAMERVTAGEGWLAPELVRAAFSHSYLRQAEESPAEELRKEVSLSPRERELIVLLCQGLKNREIAERLFISEKTVRNCLTMLFTKLDVRDRLELVFYSIRRGLAEPDG
jgi:DNA-binding NarL/FixJ family response regulator